MPPDPGPIPEGGGAAVRRGAEPLPPAARYPPITRGCRHAFDIALGDRRADPADPAARLLHASFLTRLYLIVAPACSVPSGNGLGLSHTLLSIIFAS